MEPGRVIGREGAEIWVAPVALEIMVALAIVPLPALGSSGAETTPGSVPMVIWPIVPWPAAEIVPPIVPVTLIVPMAPVLSVPPLVTELIVALAIVPLPALVSSGAETTPERVPMVIWPIVPWPAAEIVPPMVPVTLIVPMAPALIVLPLLTELLVALPIVPPPACASSRAESEP